MNLNNIKNRSNPEYKANESKQNSEYKNKKREDPDFKSKENE